MNCKLSFVDMPIVERRDFWIKMWATLSPDIVYTFTRYEGCYAGLATVAAILYDPRMSKYGIPEHDIMRVKVVKQASFLAAELAASWVDKLNTDQLSIDEINIFIISLLRLTKRYYTLRPGQQSKYISLHSVRQRHIGEGLVVSRPHEFSREDQDTVGDILETSSGLSRCIKLYCFLLKQEDILRQTLILPGMLLNAMLAFEGLGLFYVRRSHQDKFRDLVSRYLEYDEYDQLAEFIVHHCILQCSPDFKLIGFGDSEIAYMSEYDISKSCIAPLSRYPCGRMSVADKEVTQVILQTMQCPKLCVAFCGDA